MLQDTNLRESVECGRHMEANLEDLEMHNIDKSYLKATRKLGWENM